MGVVRVLLVDDDVELAELVGEYLTREGFALDPETDGTHALDRAVSGDYQLTVLDVMLPGVSGFDLLRGIRATSKVPVLMLTARGDDVDRIVGLELGADDYLSKPFSPRELVARVRALLRRTGERAKANASSLSFDGGRLCVDTERHQALVVGRPVELTPSEFKLLLALARSPGRVFSRFELVNRVQGHDYEGYERTIDAHVKNLRRKIEPDPGQPRYVQTVHGVGYRLASSGPG